MIDEEYLEIIRQLIEQQKVSFDWQMGDLLLVDNMWYSHGREPFTGKRQLLVGMCN